MRFFLSIAFVGLISGVAQAAAHSLEPGDLFRMQWATDPQIRPDGTQIVYARVANDIMTDRLVSSLWLIDTATGAQTPLAPGSGSNSSPRWSPDGSRIAYLSTNSDGRTQLAAAGPPTVPQSRPSGAPIFKGMPPCNKRSVA
jgi:dipeptidyl aminopeptidase/acylaminoacyl peptidase